MKLSDALITMIVKKGVLYEARNTDAEFEMPDGIKIKVTIEHMTIKVEKTQKEDA